MNLTPEQLADLIAYLQSLKSVSDSGRFFPTLPEVPRAIPSKFFKTRTPPVSAEETTQLFAFMEAAEESKRQKGAPVKLADVLAKAKGK